MKRDLDLSIEKPGVVGARISPSVLAVGFAVVAILIFYWRTTASIVAIWMRSETFAHGFVIVPICLWLAWRNRFALAAIPSRPWWPGLMGVLAAGALWLFAAKAGAGVVQQFALAFMLQAAIITIIGLRRSAALVFPLAFLLFAVPTGEFLIPTLMEWTADFTVSALRLSGVPVYREANYFVIPSGAWSVVEACAGLRYVIASLVVGVLYAAVTYRSALRRTLFIIASILVPIVANWLRAYMIVMIGHLSSNKLATGIDHVIYGWVFFGLVMLLLFWVGSFWREFDSSDQFEATRATSLSRIVDTPSTPIKSSFVAALATVVAAAVWQPLEMALGTPLGREAVVLRDVSGTNGWATSTRVVDWRPDYEGYKTELRQTFDKDGRSIGLYIAYYRNQAKGRELITSGNQLTMPKNWQWKQLAAASDTVRWNEHPTTVDRVELAGLNQRINVFSLYWIGGRVTASPYTAKALQAWSNLTGLGDDGALIAMYAPVAGDGRETLEAMRAFAADMSPAIERALIAARDGGQ